MRKQSYEKPAMRVVEIRQHDIICTNPASMEGQSLGKYSGGDDTVTEDNDIW